MSGQGKSEASPVVGKQPSSPSLRMAPVTGSPTGRLPSFKPPRDLTLGSLSRPPIAGPAGRGVRGVPGMQQDPSKKKFVPNLNVQRRDKASISEPAKSKVDGKSESNKKQPPQRNRTFARPELIQTIGSVFSDGMGSDAAIRRRFGGGGSGGGDGSSAALERPKINLKSLNTKFDRAAEEERLKELLRDDFIDDLTTGNLVPVQLPMIDTGKVFKEEVKKEEEDDDELRIMRDGKARVKKSNVILDSDDDDDDDDIDKINLGKKDTASKPSKSVIKSLKKESSSAPKSELQFSDLVRSQNGDLLFIQLPDHLPGFAAEVKDETPELGNSKPTQSKTQCTLDNLSEGYFGKLQIRSSGRTQMVIGDMVMDVNFGTQVGFLQELVSIDVHQPQQEQPGQRATGDISVLGRVRHRLVVTPEWGKLFRVESSPDVESSDDEIEVLKTS